MDYVLRQRFSVSAGAGSINPFFLEELPLPAKGVPDLAPLVARLSLVTPALATVQYRAWVTRGVSEPVAFTDHERQRLRAAVDAVVAVVYGLRADDLRHVLADSDQPLAFMQAGRNWRSLDPKSFWRVDKEKDPELRHTVLTLAAFLDLEEHVKAAGGNREQGISAFLAQNNGEGWMLPETLTLAELGLGHDDRAKVPQPVRERMGPRFYDFQLAQSPEESWKECALHARNLLGELGFAALERELAGEPGTVREPLRRVAEPPVPPYPPAPRPQTDIFDG